MNVNDRDDIDITTSKSWKELVSSLTIQGRRTIQDSNVMRILYSKSRRRIYIECWDMPSAHKRNTCSEIEDAWFRLSAQRIKVRVIDMNYKEANACFECGTEHALELHHVVPRSRGGTACVPLCDHCHQIITSQQDVSTIGKHLFSVLDSRVRADEKFPDKVCQRYGGRFVNDRLLEAITNALIAYSRDLDLAVALNPDYQSLPVKKQRRLRDIVRWMPLPTTRVYTHKEKLNRSTAIGKEAHDRIAS